MKIKKMLTCAGAWMTAWQAMTPLSAPDEKTWFSQMATELMRPPSFQLVDTVSGKLCSDI